MSKQLFNRNNPAVIKAAIESRSVLEFVALYEETTTATSKTLIEVYSNIRSNNKAAIIQMNSGTTNNDEPIETITPIKIKTKMITTNDVTGAPKMRIETDNGETIRVPMDQIEKMEPLEKANAKAVEKANKGAKLAKEKVVKEKVEKTPKAEKVAGAPTKQDKIVELLIGGATSKEIKLLLAEEGLKVYDSEIMSAKKKVPTPEV